MSGFAVHVRPQNSTSKRSWKAACELVDYTLALSRSANLGQRLRIDGQQTLEFTLFIDAARVTPWGDGTEGTSLVRAAVDLTGTIASREHIVYARVVPGRSTIPGNYADTIPVTLDYGP